MFFVTYFLAKLRRRCRKSEKLDYSRTRIPKNLADLYFGAARKRWKVPPPREKQDFVPAETSPMVVRYPQEHKLMRLPSTNSDAPLIVDHSLAHFTENMKDHHTEKFNPDLGLIVRRGQPFLVTIVFDRDVTTADIIRLVFRVSKCHSPKVANGTMVALNLEADASNFDDPSEWGAYIQELAPKSVKVIIKTAADCPVTAWVMTVQTKVQADSMNPEWNDYRLFIFTVLFNAWCQHDAVYLPDETARHEHVLDDTTIQYSGNYFDISHPLWYIGQFQDFVLPCLFHLLEKIVNLDATKRGNPIEVTRAITSITHDKCTNAGILNADDLRNFKHVNDATYFIKSSWVDKVRKPGQCFTFAAVTLCFVRALGIPSRSVTIFSSAIDRDISLTIDHVFDSNGKLISNESNYNFHVWTECWMTRPDLHDNGVYDGWQAIDGTPNVNAANCYRCGPFSVLAIKHGVMTKPYEGAYFYSSVNADDATWKMSEETHEIRLVDFKTDWYGRNISTKKLGSYDREDITLNYKFPEHTDEERESFRQALATRDTFYSMAYYGERFDELVFTPTCKDPVRYGDPVVFNLKIESKTQDIRKIEGFIQAYTVSWNGLQQDVLKRKQFAVELKTFQKATVEFNLEFEQYDQKLHSLKRLILLCDALIVEKDQPFVHTTQVNFIYPKMLMAHTLMSDGRLEVRANIENTMAMDVRKAFLDFDSPCLEQSKRFKIEGLPPGEKRSVNFILQPMKCRELRVTGHLSMKGIQDVAESIFIPIDKQPHRRYNEALQPF